MTTYSAPPPRPPGETGNSDEPRSWWLRLWRRVIHWLSPPADAEALREVVEELMDEPSSASGISSAERLLLSNIIKLREQRVADCMVHRADIVAVDVNGTVKEMTELMSSHGFSRIPVYRGTLDDVIGMVHVKDVVPCLSAGRTCLIPDLLRPVLYVAPSMPAARLLVQMRASRQHMAVVIDEFGGIDGLVTIEDLVELIVGEIEDEHDAPPPPPVIIRGDGIMLADGGLDIESFETQAALTLPPLESEEVDTLGGYVAHLAGRVPQVGEAFRSTGGLEFEILEMEQSRVKRLRIRPARRVADKAGAAAG